MMHKIGRLISHILQLIALWCIKHSNDFRVFSFDLKLWDVYSDGNKVTMIRKYKGASAHDGRLSDETKTEQFYDDDILYVVKKED